MRSLRDSVFAERVRQHRGGARPASVALGDDASNFEVGGKKRCIKTNYYVAIYSVPRVLHACYSVQDVSDAESQGPSGPRSEVQNPEGFSIDSSIAGIGTLHPLLSFKC